MNVDIITTVLNDFATFWKNIWEFLRPIMNLVSTGVNEFFVKGEHADNWELVGKAFSGETANAEALYPDQQEFMDKVTGK